MSSGRACSDDGDRPLWVQEQLLLSGRGCVETGLVDRSVVRSGDAYYAGSWVPV